MSSLSGALAGLTAVLVTYPLELVRTRMAFRICTDETALAYRTLTSSLRQVLSQEGALGLTLTLTPTPTLTLTLSLSLTLSLTRCSLLATMPRSPPTCACSSRRVTLTLTLTP